MGFCGVITPISWSYNGAYFHHTLQPAATTLMLQKSKNPRHLTLHKSTPILGRINIQLSCLTDDKPSFHHPFTIISYRVGDFFSCLSNWINSPPNIQFFAKNEKQYLWFHQHPTSPASNFKIFGQRSWSMAFLWDAFSIPAINKEIWKLASPRLGVWFPTPEFLALKFGGKKTRF